MFEIFGKKVVNEKELQEIINNEILKNKKETKEKFRVKEETKEEIKLPEPRIMYGYKAFNKDLTCRKYQYEIGKFHEYEGTIKLGEKGFHFSDNFISTFNSYPLNQNMTVCEIEANGIILSGEGWYNDIHCTNRIKLIKQLTTEEIIRKYYSEYNSGYNDSIIEQILNYIDINEVYNNDIISELINKILKSQKLFFEYNIHLNTGFSSEQAFELVKLDLR